MKIINPLSQVVSKINQLFNTFAGSLGINSSKIKQIIVIQGPTASGKTALAIALAKKLNTVILSADSRQFYREMSIGTAKPSLAEQEGIPHYFIDSHSILEPVTSAVFAEQANVVLQQEFKLHEQIVLVGGSGMFIDALCNGLDEIPHDNRLRDELTAISEDQGLEPLLEELRKKDPVFYQLVDRNNPARIIRALEAIRLTGKSYSELRTQKRINANFEKSKFVIDLPREILYDRINKRVDQMLENGLLDEVQRLLPHKGSNALRTVGYSEYFSYLEGDFTLERATELVKQNTRRYAKRQLTWFRRDEESFWLQELETELQLQKILEILASK